MDFLDSFHDVDSQGQVQVTAEQGSRFAKTIANDYNPIHHAGSKRFCVPGDLLFALAVSRYGLAADMHIRFLDLLKAGVGVSYPDVPPQGDQLIEILNEQGKPTLNLALSGERSIDTQQQSSLVRNYVAFSGHNFPSILVPLMREQGVMINPARPLVIYEGMTLQFGDFDFTDLEVELSESRLEVNGKRGEVALHFRLHSTGRDVGSGCKTLILSGLRDYNEDSIQAMCDEYAKSKQDNVI